MSTPRVGWLSGRRRRRIGAALALVAVVVVVIVVVTAGSSSPNNAAASASTATGAATVQRRDLVETDTESGTLSYDAPQTVYNRLSGTITWLPNVGRVIHAGGTLFKVDGEPVILMNGTTPAYRDLSAADSAGEDILQLNRNLVDLGFNPDGIVIDDTWQAATTDAVELFQGSLGEPETGILTLGQIVFLPGDQLISTVDGTVGSTGGGGSAGSNASLTVDPPAPQFVSLRVSSSTTTPTTSTTTEPPTTTPTTSTPTTTSTSTTTSTPTTTDPDDHERPQKQKAAPQSEPDDRRADPAAEGRERPAPSRAAGAPFEHRQLGLGWRPQKLWRPQELWRVAQRRPLGLGGLGLRQLGLRRYRRRHPGRDPADDLDETGRDRGPERIEPERGSRR